MSGFDIEKLLPQLCASPEHDCRQPGLLIKNPGWEVRQTDRKYSLGAKDRVELGSTAKKQ